MNSTQNNEINQLTQINEITHQYDHKTTHNQAQNNNPSIHEPIVTHSPRIWIEKKGKTLEKMNIDEEHRRNHHAAATNTDSGSELTTNNLRSNLQTPNRLEISSPLVSPSLNDKNREELGGCTVLRRKAGFPSP
ncbi:unnamed protein product [Microthlaspi erraticum]|uniref:Uncharacterized protein n=1 Tax=Microthlaspi erraticum TaxID=1685480 RepID=A0A6D2K082_9BRAS|nr:unnamed protein product [Microthlaspi erraticum]CAA7047522.1 unnamed protein product [Microthlaspi erraticum]